MKSAYELAMEKFGGDATPKLTAQQKAEIAEIDNRFKAKIAEAEVMSQQQIDQAADDPAKVDQMREALATEIRRMREKAERQKNKIRERET
ncbi:MAG TPA: hypothetical protein DIT01_19255 [Lentisphaeria bacterium]|nr:hypothetical protein [Lentisphaeria bacterium]|tara:strand:- start:6701 stop:6973 length:273 start_codon:yes stop_codon:yes gene_type:complete